MNKENDVVFPGDFLSTAEEYLPGYGVYEEEGNLYSAIIGIAQKDMGRMLIKVAPLTSTPVFIKRSDRIIGQVRDVKGSMATVEVLRVIGRSRKVSGETFGIIHISKISDKYLPSIQEALRSNDFIRAKVIMAAPAIRLTTAEPDLGVILAKCPQCGTVLVRKGDALFCPKCEVTYRRKLAQDYGTGKV